MAQQQAISDRKRTSKNSDRTQNLSIIYLIPAMCIVFIANQVHPKYPLIIAANRDEFFDRPTEPMKLRYNGNYNTNSDELTTDSPIGGPAGAIRAIPNRSSATSCEPENDTKERNDHGQHSHHDHSVKHNEKCHEGGHEQRPTKRVSLAGRDLVGGGTWIGLAFSPKYYEHTLQTEKEGIEDTTESPKSMRWIALTNFRSRKFAEEHGRPSRGELLLEFLDMAEVENEHPTKQNCHSHRRRHSSAESFISELKHGRGQEYNGFNVLAGDETGIYYYGNRDSDGVSDGGGDESVEKGTAPPQPLPPGIYGLSNGLLDTPWPKVKRGKSMFETFLNNACNNREGAANLSFDSFYENLLQILQDTTQPNDDELPDTGVGYEAERYLSSIFVPEGLLCGRKYGTRCSTVVVVQSDGRVNVLERTYPDGKDIQFSFRCTGLNPNARL